MENIQEQNITMEEIVPVGTIICVIREVLQRWYLIVTVALVAAMAAFIVSDAAYTPQYRANTTLVVSAGSTFSTTYQNLTAATETAAVFTGILNSSLLRHKVAEETGITNFDGTINVSTVGNTNLLNVSVQGSDARTVFLMTQSLIDNHCIVSSEVLGNVVIEVLQEPVVPAAPINSRNTFHYTKLAAMLSAGVTVALLGYCAWMADRIRTRAEADRKLSCRILGELHHERKRRTLWHILRKRKAGILITNPLTSVMYAEAVHKISGRIDKLRRKGQRVVMVTSLLENEGKSTVTVNLALSWAAKGRRVLLVDCDLRKPSCHKILGVSEAPGVLKVLQGESPLEEQIAEVPGTTLHLLPGGRGVRNASAVLSSDSLGEMLRSAARQYDLVVVDTPPMGLAPDAECIGEFTHCAVVVVRQNAAQAEAVNEAISDLEDTGTHLLGCVLNNVYGIATFAPAYNDNQHGGYGRKKYGYYRYGYGYGYGGKKKKSGEGEEGAE